MKVLTRTCIVLTCLALLLAGWLTPATPAAAGAWVVPPAPQPAGDALDAVPGTIYYGAVPAGSSSKPVLVFVQGMHRVAQEWWGPTEYYGNNDMYAYAYNAGYRTAFVELNDSGGTGATMWANGQMLSNQLATITAHYGVSTVNIIAHSKGGVDTQTALVHYGAASRVQKVFTLSSPHWGSPTADLAYSWWAGWLASLLGQRDDAVYVVQTGYMSYYRSITDNRSENTYTRYYTGAGTEWGPMFSSLWFGGSYLSGYGSNDGLVTTTSARNPRGTHIFTRALDHDNIRIGNKVFPTVISYVGTNWRTAQPGPALSPVESTNPNASTPATSIVRGGQVDGKTSETVTLERGVEQVRFALLSNAQTLNVVWTAPDGTPYVAKAQAVSQGEVFGGAYAYTLDIAAPAAGAWRATITPATTDAAAYLLTADVTSGLTLTLERDAKLTFQPGEALALHMSVTDAAGRTVRDLRASGHLTLDGADAGVSAPFALAGDGLSAQITLPATAGVANVAVTVTGTLSDGSAFERAVVVSVPVGLK